MSDLLPGFSGLTFVPATPVPSKVIVKVFPEGVTLTLPAPTSGATTDARLSLL